MNHNITQTAGLLKFISGIQTIDNTIQTNMLDDELSFVSTYYTPNLEISNLASIVLNDLVAGNVKVVDYDYNKNSLVNNTRKTSLKVQAPRIYLIIQSIVLEAYAIVNTFTENSSNLKYMTTTSIQKTINNVQYVCDYLGDFEEYFSVLQDLRDLETSLSYINLQLPIIKKERGIVS